MKLGLIFNTLLLSNGLSIVPFADGCTNNSQNQIQYMRCLDSKLDEIKRKNTSWINKIKIDLQKRANEQDDSAPLVVFTRSEQRFNKYVEDECRWRYLNMLPDNMAAGLAFKQCELQLLHQRIAMLQAP